MENQYEDIELQIRMKMIKCERYKTFQEDPPNKKYLYIKECDSIHGLNILPDDNIHLDKASEANFQLPTKEDTEVEKENYEEEKVEVAKENEIAEDEVAVEEEAIEEQVEEIEEKVAEEETVEETEGEEFPEIRKAKTGVFSDLKRRIDIVLVVEDNASTATDCLKLEFLTNILRTGLEMEIEPGRMEIHKHLYFIKLHAPDSVLNEYGNMFAVKRYFINNRLVSNNIHGKSHEIEWLKIMRSNYTTPNGYSNYERSLIVYKILRHLPFGGHSSQYGLHSLLKRNIILDAYALHDGPYFYISNKTARGANGRQILHHNWVGIENLFQRQPLHVIHEYFGPKIAFYYAFYGFYNVALTLASIAGIVSVLMPYIAPKEPDAMKQVCKDKREMCPECYTFRCQMRPSEDYCTPIAMNVHLDHPYVIYFSLFMVSWAIVVITVWRRKEYILNWMWEVGGLDSYYETSKRPEFNVDYKNRRRSAKTGFKYDESGFHKLIRISLSIILIPLGLVGTIPIMQLCSTTYDRFADLFLTKEKSTKTKEYLILATFTTFYTLFISALERIFHFLFYYLVDLENHKSYKAYEEALITKQFVISVTLMYPFMFYYGWLVGNLQVYLGGCIWPERLPLIDLFFMFHNWLKITPWNYFYGRRDSHYTKEIRQPLCYTYCWPFTCINEVSIIMIVMLVLKQVVFRVVFHINRLTTDYNEDRKNTDNFSCWEYEYKLDEFSEAQLTRKYMILAVQFTLITFFVIAFPLAPLVVLVVNLWDLRHSARKLLLASRRPLLIRSPGIGAWNNILLFTAYAAIATNVLTLLLTTRQSLREYFQKPLNTTLILNFLLYKLDIYYPPPSKTDKMICYAPYLLVNSKELEVKYSWFGITGATKNEWYIIQMLSLKMIFIFGFITLSLAVALQYNIFKPYRRDIEKTKAIENKIKNLHYHNDILSMK